MIFFTFQYFDQFTYSVSPLRAACTVLAGENRRLAPHAARRFERTQAQLAGRRAWTWLRCNSLEWNNHSPGLSA